MEKMIIPKELYSEIRSNNCILFAGAGISTEGGIYGKPTLYEIIKRISKYSKKKKPSFPELMQYYCDNLDGGRKNRLIRVIINRIEDFSEYGEIYVSTTMFHRYVASIPYFKIVVTTNWDPFFERELNVLVPMVEDIDIPFWDDNKRQILKIHGCVTRPYTIVATSNDYSNCIKERSKNPIFTKLKDLMATKTFIFVGYSMRDPDVHIIFDQLLNNLGDFARLSYAIDPQPSEEVIKNWSKRGVKILKLSAIAFMRELENELEKEGIIPNPELIQFYAEQRELITEIHLSTSQSTDKGFASSMYQDGVIHELDYIIGQCKFGVTFETLENKFKENLGVLKEHTRRMNLVEVAYWKGRIEVIKRFLSRRLRPVPPYFDPKKMKPVNK